MASDVRTMKAAVLYEAGRPQVVEEVELRGPGRDEVLARVTACGVCHSDLHIIRGEWAGFEPPLVAGHEGAGIVEEVGEGVKHVRPGDHIVLGWKSSCGECRYCVAGRPYLCADSPRPEPTSSISKRGQTIRRSSIFAYFAEFAVVPKSVAIPIPVDVPLDRAALLSCAVATGVGAVVNTAKVRPGATVAVFGCGGVGLGVVQGAAMSGAARVIGVDLRPEKLEFAGRFGLTDAVNGSECDAVAAIVELTGGVGADYAFEAVGSAAVVEQAMASLARGGVCVVAGMPAYRGETRVSIPLMPLFGDRWITASYYGGTNLQRDIPRLVDLYRRGKLDLTSLIGE